MDVLKALLKFLEQLLNFIMKITSATIDLLTLASKKPASFAIVCISAMVLVAVIGKSF